MKKQILLINCLLFLLSCAAFAQQKTTVKGVVKDALSDEGLVQATIKITDSDIGTVTDLDGNYLLELPEGQYEFIVTYIGYKEQKVPVTIASSTLLLDFKLEEDNVLMQEVSIVADVARSRETPIAFTTIPQAKIAEEVSTQDLPMVLNSTPGVYSTQQGGGDGDARITIRGFNQRNVAILIDGIPVNDMENGWVFWSNWNGLNEVTRSLQVQRGLGASKLALPSVGGTVNLLTKGASSKRRFSIKQEYGSNNYFKTTFAGTTGRSANGWGLTFVASYKDREGWVNNTWSNAWFYFAKLEKIMGKHTLSLSAVGAPQEHAQRSFKQDIALYDRELATELLPESNGWIDTTGIPERGVRFNQHWGLLERLQVNDGHTIRSEQEVLTERLNYYHKPQFSLRHFWTPSNRFSLSNILYMSLGNGGGTSNEGSGFRDMEPGFEGQWNYQQVYNSNAFPLFPNPDGNPSSNILATNINNHVWYGFLSTFDYEINSGLQLSGGLDLRSYRGIHFREVFDLLGGQYYIDRLGDGFNENIAQDTRKLEGDKIDYHYDSQIQWGGLFAQLEYKQDKISAFVNVSNAYSIYKRIDYFLPQDVVLADTTISQAVTHNMPLEYEGQIFEVNGENTRPATTNTRLFPGYTIKAGLNYNLNRHHNIFFNTGYLARAPRYNNVFLRGNVEADAKNEKVIAFELGYGAKYSKFALNANAYYTLWLERPQDRPSTYFFDDQAFTLNIPGLKARHAGMELDFVYKITPQLELQGLFSFGDWIWDSGSSTSIYTPQGDSITTVTYSARGVHVGDAAQLQLGSTLRYEPIKNLYFKLKYVYFGKQYADFEPLDLSGQNADRESWQMPNYSLFDGFAGYRFNLGKTRLDLRLSVLNLLNTSYISDAQLRNDFGVDRVEVFFGQGTRFSTSLKWSF